MSAEAVKPKAAEPAATTWVGDDGVTKEELEALDLAKFPWLGKSLRSTLELAKNPLRRLLSDKIMTLATRNVKLEPMDDSNAAFPKLLEEVKKVAKERNQELTDKEAMDVMGGKAPVVGNLSESQAAQIKKRLEAAGGAATVGGGIKIEKDFMLQIFFPGDNAAEFLMDTMKLQLKDVRGNFKDEDETDGTFDPADASLWVVANSKEDETPKPPTRWNLEATVGLEIVLGDGVRMHLESDGTIAGWVPLPDVVVTGSTIKLTDLRVLIELEMKDESDFGTAFSAVLTIMSDITKPKVAWDFNIATFWAGAQVPDWVQKSANLETILSELLASSVNGFRIIDGKFTFDKGKPKLPGNLLGGCLKSCCSSFGPADCWQTCTFFPRLCCGLCCAYVEGQRDN